ncbi:MAG: hypothetical protein ABF264_01415 [Flavobacteriales bacterium]
MKRYLNYHFENIITKSSNFVYFLLIIASLSALFMLGLQIFFGLAENDSLFNLWWDSLSEIISIGEGSSSKERIINFLFWALSVAISGTIIAFLTAKVSSFISNLNRGESFVIDKNHYVIIGWNSNVYKVFKEIETANLNQKKPTILCFNEMGNVEMRAKIDIEYPDQKNIRIITRTGDIYSVLDLERTNAVESKSVIILDDHVKKDFNIETTILAMRRTLKDSSVNIIAQFKNPENIPVLSNLIGDQLLPIHKNKVIANLTAQSIRSSLIQEVMMDFMDYDGDEIYFFPSDKLVGKKFMHAMLFLNDITIIGILDFENNIILNPDKNHIIQSTDKLIVIAEDDTNVLDYKPADNVLKILDSLSVPKDEMSISEKESKSILVLGWSELGQLIVDSAISFLGEESELFFIYNDNLINSKPNVNASNSKTTLIQCSENEHIQIENLISENNFDIILILGYDDVYSAEVSDTYAMMKNIFVKSYLDNNSETRIILHLNDGAKKNLISSEIESEFIVSDVLSALMITQLADNPLLRGIFEELFSDEGLKINLRPYENDSGLENGQLVLIEDLIIESIKKDETFIGCVVNGQLFLNPKKNQKIEFNESILRIVIS